MTPPALLFTGRVAHVRHVPPRVRFAYRLWMLGLDLDRLDAIGGRLFRHNAAGIVGLRDRDHGPRDGGALRPWVEQRLAEAGLSAFAARIHFLLIPRVLGYGFNPIAFYFCHDAAGRLGAVLHQVKNTFGGQHGYLMPVEPGATTRQRAAKRMHVSPFFDLHGGYQFAFSAPDFSRADGGTGFALSIRYGTPEARRLTATMRLRAQPLTDAALARQLAAMPLMPLKVIAAIHWQALLLWLRGARYHPAAPAPAAPVSLGVSA